MYKCTSCGGRLKFDIASQQLKCEYCDTLYDPYETGSEAVAEEETLYDVTVFSCPQCGGEIYSTDEMAAGFCSFCGAEAIFKSRLESMERPDHIIPFKLTKDDCKKAYSDLMRKAIFAPKELKDPKYIDGFRGIYMPYWVYNFTQQGHVSIPAKDSFRVGDYIYTNHVNLVGDVDALYEGISYDASSTFADDISARIAPYSIYEMKDFSPSFMSGFYADVSDVASPVYSNDAERVALQDSFKRIMATPKFRKYTSKATENSISEVSTQQKTTLTMFPVWFLSYRKKDRVSYATVNGQTGKVVLDLPIDVPKFLLGSLLLAFVIFYLLNLVFTFRPTVTLWVTIALSAITYFLYKHEATAIKKRDTHEDDKGARQRIRVKAAHSYENNFLVAGSIVAFIISLFVQITQPVSDLYYYGAIIVSLVVEFLLLLDLISKYNILSTRPLPQFNHRGGDDRA